MRTGDRSQEPGARSRECCAPWPSSNTETPVSCLLSPVSCLHAFTMVEIAISLAVIGFALVAIIGILPSGMQVQKENRHETIIVQDESMFMDAIRGGAQGLDDLTNYVDAITNWATPFKPSGVPSGPAK